MSGPISNPNRFLQKCPLELIVRPTGFGPESRKDVGAIGLVETSANPKRGRHTACDDGTESQHFPEQKWWLIPICFVQAWKTWLVVKCRAAISTEDRRATRDCAIPISPKMWDAHVSFAVRDAKFLGCSSGLSHRRLLLTIPVHEHNLAPIRSSLL